MDRGIVCRNCRGDHFVDCEYKAGDLRAPALQCATCGVLHLEEAAAASRHERESVRLAKAARAQSSGSWAFGKLPPKQGT